MPFNDFVAAIIKLWLVLSAVWVAVNLATPGNLTAAILGPILIFILLAFIAKTFVFIIVTIARGRAREQNDEESRRF